MSVLLDLRQESRPTAEGGQSVYTPGDLDSDRVEIVALAGADRRQYTGVRLRGPRGAIRGVAWFSDPGKVAVVIDDLRRALGQM